MSPLDELRGHLAAKIEALDTNYVGQEGRGAARDLKAKALRIVREEPAVTCTGVTAGWCPVHGGCRCRPALDGTPSFDDPACPLHSVDSAHGAGGGQ